MATPAPTTAVRRDREGEQVQPEQSEEQQQQTSSSSSSSNFRTDRFKNGCGLTLMEAIEQQKNQSNSNNNLPPRFFGVLKERYSDFIVRERAPTPLYLRSMQVPETCKDPAVPKIEDYQLPTEEKMRETLTEVFAGSEDLEILIKALKENPKIDQVTLPTPRTEKLARAKIHQALKTCGFPESGTSSTSEIFVIANPTKTDGRSGGGKKDGNAKNAKAQWGGRAGGQPQYQQNGALINRVLWPQGRGEHLHFTLYKENLESSAALRQIAAKLGIPLRMIQYCGNKDKRAVTTQRLSCRYLSAQSVAKLNGMSYGRTSLVRLGDFEYKTDPLQLGRLLGNGFTITLRRVNDEACVKGVSQEDAAASALNASEESLKRFEKSLQENGFANYFGPQRFGTTGIPSYEVGKALLRCDYAAALLLCFESKAQIAPDFVPALQAYRDEQNVEKALKLTPYHCTFERDALIALNAASNKNDIQRAILALPRPLTMLYCHSVQSLVWNTMVSERLKAAPYVLEGDMVLDDGNELVAEGGDDEEQGKEEQAADPSTPATPVTASANNNNTKTSPLPTVHFVTKEDIESNKYKLSDVLLPIPGNDPDLQYPKNEVSGKDAYIKVMHQDLGIGDGLLKANEFTEKRFHIHGAYRQMVVVPENFSLKMVTYSSNDELLVETDFQKIVTEQKHQNQNNNNTTTNNTNTNSADAAVPSDENNNNNGIGEFNPNKLFVANTNAAAQNVMTEQARKFAVITSFELPAGAYATSVLREMCEAISDSRMLK